jgi:hypothetical protein
MATDFDEKEVYIGRRAQELRGLLKIKWPVEHGIVSVSSRIVVGLVELTRMLTMLALEIRSRTGTIWNGYGTMSTGKVLAPHQKRSVGVSS